MTDPAALRLNTTPPPVHIETIAYYTPSSAAGVVSGMRGKQGLSEVRLTGPFTDQPTLPPGSRRIEIHYTATSVAAPAKVRFQVKWKAPTPTGKTSATSARPSTTTRGRGIRVPCSGANNDAAGHGRDERRLHGTTVLLADDWFRAFAASLLVVVVGRGLLVALPFPTPSCRERLKRAQRQAPRS